MEKRTQILRRLYAGYGGVLLAALYGVTIRFSLTNDDLEGLDTLMVVVVLPIVIGCLPFLFANATQLMSRGYRAGGPALAAYAFLVCGYWHGREEIIDIVVFAIPMTFLAGIVGLILGWAVGRLRSRC